MNNKKIIVQLQGGDPEKAFTRLYTFYPKIEKHILINSGSKEEALDIFQEALILLYKKVQHFSPDSTVQVDGFLINTCKLLWSNELRKKKVRKKGSPDSLKNLEYEDEIQEQLEKEAKLKTIETVLKQLGEKCKNMLEAFYYKNFSMDKIAKRFGYKTVQSAKTKKYKCMEHARKLALSLNTTSEGQMQGEMTNLKND